MPGTGASFVAAAGMLALVLSPAAAAEPLRWEGPAAVTEVLEGDLLRLSDGRIVRLAGIRIPAAEVEQDGAPAIAGQARAELIRLLDGLTVRLAPAEMLALEHAARAQARGLWAVAAFMPQDARALRDSTGHFRIVRGRVVRVAPTESYVYLNFGDDWRADFTVRVRRAELDGAFAGIELAGLAGSLVEVRGVVLDAGGPLIELSHPEQLQVLP